MGPLGRGGLGLGDGDGVGDASADWDMAGLLEGDLVQAKKGAVIQIKTIHEKTRKKTMKSHEI